MRLVLTIALYLGYIRAFCDYLLTGQFDWLPADPAGMLAHAAQLDQVLARPDGMVLCGLFALGCYGVAGCLANVLRDIPAWLFHTPTHVDYDLGRGMVGKMREANSAPAARDNAAPSA